MLTHLTISNYAIIERIELDFKDGFTVITGETGAGKSILLGALSLILGNRVDTSVLNNKDEKCIIEGIFHLEKSLFTTYFLKYDIDFEEDTIVRREISRTGKTRAFINDTPVSLSVLKGLTSQLVDIHSQHQTLNLKDNSFQLNVIDSFANLSDDYLTYSKQYKTFKEKEIALKELQTIESNAKSDIDYLQFQINELEEFSILPNEKETIEDKLAVINNAESIKQTIDNTLLTLSNADQNIISNLGAISNSFASIATINEEYSDLNNRLNSVYIELADISKELENVKSNIDFNPEEAQYLSDRLSSILSLEQKHRVNDANTLIEILAQLKSKLESINNTDEIIKKLEKEVVIEKDRTFQIAQDLSGKRTKVFLKLADSILQNLKGLGMPEASFRIKNIILDNPTVTGIDDVQFLFSANKGFKEIELEKTASGGELSRLMLTIKSILAKSNSISSIIFDEIDTGVSGDIAHKMASIMQLMSKNIQIIAITHLPQVAAKGEQHIKIYKATKNNKTATYLKELEKEERIEEIAKMLSGKNLTKEAKLNAKALLT